MVDISSDKSKIPALVDALDRKLTYLRISLTDKCNFRCFYCYGSAPEIERTAKLSLMSSTEIVDLIKVFGSLGVNKVRLTGGEPLLNPSVVDIVRNISEIPGIKQIGLTTNGFLLKEKLSELIKAGLNRLNVSLDSLEREKFCEVTGVDGLPQVLEGLRAARDSGAFQRVKVNTVVMRGVNDSEVGNLAKWSLENGFELRFIEYMPTRNTLNHAKKHISEADIRSKIDLELQPDIGNSTSAGPARTYKVDGYPGRIGFISALSQKFCESCNRLRLKADGRLVGCLFRDNSVDLISMLRSGMSLDDLAYFVRNLVAKPEFKDEADFTESGFRPEMKTIGG